MPAQLKHSKHSTASTKVGEQKDGKDPNLNQVTGQSNFVCLQEISLKRPAFSLSQIVGVMRYNVQCIRGTLHKNTPRGAKRLCRGAPKRKSTSVHVSTSGGDEIKPHYNPRTTACECGKSAQMQNALIIIRLRCRQKIGRSILFL